MSLERLDSEWTKCSFIYIHNLGTMVGSDNRPRKTNIYEVLTEDNTKLGEIRWFGRWRKYCFYPWTQTIYEETCMRDIAQFIEEETLTQRKIAANKRKAASA